ncbi:OLC1v1025647C1 [Oldenlandia corymbosa var. corymbosa]|uniref:OLC1v1025647C1 n=1 Tax=Oldenlandia corymbosa var. corymbosa TaxID=529605 RepID=A0AAV1C7D2_OLDCO|nr:OLC1v1025647C1 [Oldenlandia corymbosa var. corymbosa]
MGSYSEAHICQCLNRLMTHRRNSTVMINITGPNGETSRKTGMQFAEGVVRLARGLTQLGLRPGHVVAIAALNSDSYLEWLLAITCVGGIAAPFNYRWSLEEAKQAANEVKPVLLVTDTTCDYWHSKLGAEIKWHVSMNTVDFNTNLHGSGMKWSNSGCLNPPTLFWAPRNAALLCFTSGTSGKPKAAVISHSALVVQSLAKLALAGYSEDDVYLHTAPLCHIGGLSSALAMLMAGACHVILPKFEVKAAIKAIEDHHITALITVPTMMADLIASTRSTTTSSKQFEKVKKILNGGGGLSPVLIENCIKLFPRAKLMTAYGMTEACSSLTFMTLYDPTIGSYTQHSQMIKGRNARLVEEGGVCVGKPAPHVEVKISYDGSAEAGKILTRGPHTMLGYWGHIPSKDLEEGWFDTGDVGQIDENGNLWLMGRNSGRIKSGGENVYPEQVESIVSQHPGISGVIVLGLPDPRLAEMVVACIQLKDNWKWIESNSVNERSDHCLSKDILQKFCKEKNLTGFKIPRGFILWTTPFPMTTTGKVKRNELKKEALSRWPKQEPTSSTWPSVSSNL